MDCQKLIVYGILILVGLYLLKDVCGVKLPFIDEGFKSGDGTPEEEVVVTQELSDTPSAPSENGEETQLGELPQSQGEVAGFIFVINLFDLPGSKLLKNKGYLTKSLVEFPGH